LDEGIRESLESGQAIEQGQANVEDKECEQLDRTTR
jgi:hypothetical protein